MIYFPLYVACPIDLTATPAFDSIGVPLLVIDYQSGTPM